MINKAFIKDISVFLPPTILKNEEFRQLNEKWTPDKIYSKIGVKSRHVVDKTETSLSIALRACKKLLDKNIKSCKNGEDPGRPYGEDCRPDRPDHHDRVWHLSVCSESFRRKLHGNRIVFPVCDLVCRWLPVFPQNSAA